MIPNPNRIMVIKGHDEDRIFLAATDEMARSVALQILRERDNEGWFDAEEPGYAAIQAAIEKNDGKKA